jgi:hypothetical protein
MRAECMRFAGVAVVVASIISSAVWWWVYHPGSPEISLRQVATSDFVPLGVVVLFRCACAAVAFYTLWCVYSDNEGLEMQYLEAQVTLRRLGRWTTFTVWCFTLFFVYFTFAAYCSGAVLVGRGATVPSQVVGATLVLFEISYPMSLLVTATVTFVLVPVARRYHHSMDRMFRWRALIMHNGNVLMMQLAMLMAPPPVTLVHLPYALLFGSCYAIFAWWWFWRTRVFYYFFLDYRRPYAVGTYLGLFAALVLCDGVGYLFVEVARHEASRWWTYPCMMLLTLGMTRFRKPVMHPASGKLGLQT